MIIGAGAAKKRATHRPGDQLLNTRQKIHTAEYKTGAFVLIYLMPKSILPISDIYKKGEKKNTGGEVAHTINFPTLELMTQSRRRRVKWRK